MSKTYISAKLRRQVIENARNCCEYCLQPELFSFSPHEIDHAISEKHGGKTLFINLALACKRCNTYKGSDIASIDPETQMTTPLYHPRRDSWSDHFQIQDNELVPLTAVARTTIWLLQLNSPSRLRERSLWLTSGLVYVPH
jgi:HNH endonuclease